MRDFLELHDAVPFQKNRTGVAPLQSLQSVERSSEIHPENDTYFKHHARRFVARVAPL
jgi:hypothetical protein